MKRFNPLNLLLAVLLCALLFDALAFAANPCTMPNCTCDCHVAPTTAPTSQPAPDFTIVAGHALHLAADLTGVADPIRTRFRWDFGDVQSIYNAIPDGYNAAHAYDMPGDYVATLTFSTGKTFTKHVRVLPDTRPVVIVDSLQQFLTETAKPGRRVRAFGRYDVAGTIHTAAGVDVEGSVTLNWTGPKGKSYAIIELGADSSLRGVTFDSIYQGAGNWDSICQAVRPVGWHTIVRDCTFLHVGYCLNFNACPRFVLIQGNKAPLADGVRGYFAWVQGREITIIGNTMANAVLHCVRIDGMAGGGLPNQRILVAFNDFTNLDRRPTDPDDFARQTITLHQGEYVSIVSNKMAGGRQEIGPLGEIDGLKNPTGFTVNYVKIVGNRFDDSLYQYNRLELDIGIRHVLVAGNTILTKQGACVQLQDVGWKPVDQSIKDSAARQGITVPPIGQLAYGSRHVEDVVIASDNTFISGDRAKTVSIGKGVIAAVTDVVLPTAPSTIPVGSTTAPVVAR
jgi:hypothetical protein